MPRPDVILVGGGVISCATAYFLAKEGLRPLIVEREAIGYGASGAAAGLLSPLADLRGEGPTTELGLVSLRLHRELAQSLPAESGIDYHFSDIPVLRPAFNDDEEGELREAVRLTIGRPCVANRLLASMSPGQTRTACYRSTRV